MKFINILSTAAAALCLALSVWLFFMSAGNQSRSAELQKKQSELQTEQGAIQLQQQQLQAQAEQINQGVKLAQEIGPAVLKDLASLAVQNKNEKIRGLLAKYGVQVKEDAAAPEGGATPAPATPKP